MNKFGDLQVKGSDFVKWPQVGASVTGVVTNIYTDTPSFPPTQDPKTGEMKYPEECPHVELQTAEGKRTLSATQTVLRNLLIERQDEFDVGDTITVTFSGQAGNAKLFTLEVQKAATAAPAPASQAAPQAAPAVAPPPAPAAPAEGQPPPV
jgi:hypothetical protein